MLNVFLDLVDFVALRNHTVRFGAWLVLINYEKWKSETKFFRLGLDYLWIVFWTEHTVMLTLISDVDDLLAMHHKKEESLAFVIRLFFLACLPYRANVAFIWRRRVDFYLLASCACLIMDVLHQYWNFLVAERNVK